MNSSNDRYHCLDALRAFALLLGVEFHSALSYVLPPGLWAVGTTQPSKFLGWFFYYTHSFRMELFFLLAGFFAALVVGKRGAASFLRDRAKRILLVFIVALYPMKLAVTALWIAGGLHTGWLKLPPEAASQPWWRLALGGLRLESWPNIQLTHLWFLYYLTIITALFLATRWVLGRWFARFAVNGPAFGNGFYRVITSRWFPLLLAIITTPMLALMRGPGVDTPDQSVSWNLPVLALYGCYFTLGWWLQRHTGLLEVLARRWKSLLILGVVVSQPASISVAVQYGGGAWVTEHAAALKWATSFATSLMMALSVFGWLGCFVRYFSQPSERIRYVADASYWIYIAHLPLVVGLQVGLAKWALPWWFQLPLLNVIAFAILLLSYHSLVRFTWLGAWLNGRRVKHPRAARAIGRLSRSAVVEFDSH
jgi:peptidoglycan/LPS O-acetylase OafA/YrhL